MTTSSRTCFSANSKAMQRVNWSRAPLLMQYAKQPGKDRIPVTLETLTMLPLDLIRCGTANIVSW